MVATFTKIFVRIHHRSPTSRHFKKVPLWFALLINIFQKAKTFWSSCASDDLCFYVWWLVLARTRSHCAMSRLHTCGLVVRLFESHTQLRKKLTCALLCCSRSSNSHIWLPLPHSRNVLWTCSTIHDVSLLLFLSGAIWLLIKRHLARHIRHSSLLEI